MKISKYVKLVKSGGYCAVVHVAGSGIWLGARAAVFRATELPEMVGEEQVRTVLDMPEKAWEKVHLDEQWSGSVREVLGLNLADHEDGEQDTEKLRVMAAPSGIWCACRRCVEDGELIFYQEALLSPLAERIRDSGYIRHTVRKSESGQRYLVVHDGFEVVAAVMPMKVATKEYLADLSEFQALCTEQFCREQERAAAQPPAGMDGEEAGQAKMEKGGKMP